MTIEFSRRIYQDPIIRTLRLVRYECFINHTCVLSYDQFCAQICARFHARLINEGHYVWRVSEVNIIRASVTTGDPYHTQLVFINFKLLNLKLKYRQSRHVKDNNSPWHNSHFYTEILQYNMIHSVATKTLHDSSFAPSLPCWVFDSLPLFLKQRRHFM